MEWSLAFAFLNRNVNKVKGHLSLRKGGCHEVHDIEDLVKVGQAVKGLLSFGFICNALVIVHVAGTLSP